VNIELENLADLNHELKEKDFNFEQLNAGPSNLFDEEFLKIENCPSMSSAFETFIALIASFYMRFSTALGVFIKFHGFADYFSDQQFLQTHNALRDFKRSFLFAYETSDGNSGCIYWRLEGVEQIFYCIIGKNEANLVEFVAKYLMKAMKNGRNGEKIKFGSFFVLILIFFKVYSQATSAHHIY
jgi:hypothetical protein